ncbi:MAG TPA: CoA transferase [Xanthobacteraceae bacterium]|jgi:crotonobetainyl-CoA:carnitine CoA-transferase CaiB-like acyl-CoA transferase|nr:CoA transferase [Xanthobacteraceae bacterium]
MPYKAASHALKGLVVLDLTHARAGPVCVRQLADWGANVIRIERPGDPADIAGRHEADFQNKHRNKRGMALNLRAPEGRHILYRMVERADVLVENFRPDVKERLGFDYATLAKINPRLVYASISAFGQDGPYRAKPGVDQIVQGMSGLMSITGEPGRGPMRVGIPIADIVTGLHAALGILVALIERQASGEGQWVQASLLESQMFMLDLQAARYLVDGVDPKQVGNEHPTGVPTNVYKTRDGYVNIAPMPAMWGRLCKALGREDLANHPDFATREIRRKRRAAVNGLIQGITTEMDTATLMRRLEEAEVPCGPIYSVAEAFNDPQAKHLALGQTVTTVDGKEITLPRQPFRLSRTPSTLAVRTPEFAEHTDEVLSEVGYSQAEIAAFRASGAVE